MAGGLDQDYNMRITVITPAVFLCIRLGFPGRIDVCTENYCRNSRGAVGIGSSVSVVRGNSRLGVSECRQLQ